MSNKYRRTVSRRSVLRGIAVAGGAVAFPHVGIITARAQSGQAGGILRVSYNTSFKTLSPIKHLSNPEFMATGWMYNNLTRLDEKRKPAPDLAESWEPKDDARTWIFKLRQGAKFHNGREVTADDVAATFTAVLDPKNASPYRADLGPIDKVEAMGKYSVKFSLRSSYADLPASVRLISGRIIAQEGLTDLESLGSKDFGSGPFKLVEFVPGDRIVVERFGDYFRKGRPYLDGATIKTYPEAAVETNALRTRETDFIVDTAPEFFKQVGGTKGLDAMNTPSGTFVAVVVPADKPPFNDNRVREALKLTVDRDVMLAGAFEGYGETGQDHPISSAYQYYSAVEPRKRNVERAKALLKEAGLANGVSFTLFVAVSPPLREKLAVILKEMARPAGFDVKIEVVSYDRYLSQVWNKGLPYVVYYSTRPTPDLILKKLYHPTEGLDEGRWGVQNPDFVKLIEKAGVSVDPAERQKLYSEIYKTSRDQGTFLIPFFKSELSAKANYVKDYLARPVSYEVEIENVWLTADAPKKKI